MSCRAQIFFSFSKSSFIPFLVQNFPIKLESYSLLWAFCLKIATNHRTSDANSRNEICTTYRNNSENPLFAILSQQNIQHSRMQKIAMINSTHAAKLNSHRRIRQWTHQNHRIAVSRFPNLIWPCFRKNTGEKSWRWRKRRGWDELSWQPVWAVFYCLF